MTALRRPLRFQQRATPPEVGEPPGERPSDTSPGQDGEPDERPLAVFPAVPSSVPAARTWARQELLCDGCDIETVNAVGLLVSELATNAVRHTSTGRFAIYLAPTGNGVDIAVQDHDGSGAPHLRPAGHQDAWDEDGRGLVLVDALSSAWGVVGTGDGKWVWCTCPSHPRDASGSPPAGPAPPGP